MSIKLSFIVGLALAAGCGTAIQTTVINRAPHPMAPRPIESVELFSAGPPARPHIDVAYFEAEAESGASFDGTPEFITKLRNNAAAHGCDGLVLGTSTNHSDGGGRYATNIHGITATCIVYTAPPDWNAAPPVATATAPAPAPTPAPTVATAPAAN